MTGYGGMRSRVCLVWLLVFPGCAILGPQPDVSRFYVLEALAERPLDGVSAGSEAIAVGPLRLPDYLGRLDMAVRTGATELRYSGHERWAEPLEQGLLRVLRENLAVLLGDRPIVVVPSLAREPVRFEVPLEVVRFEPGPDARVTLLVRWSLREPPNGDVVGRQESRVVTPVAGVGGEARAAAMSVAALLLAEEIAARIVAAEGTR